MIIWINGAFGAGKTQTAYELHRRIAPSYVYDPENVGYFLRKNLPEALGGKDDFQDIPLWRQFNREMLTYLADGYSGVLLVPMTVVNKNYYEEMVGELSKRHEVRHFILCASRETLLKRLAKRGEGKRSWAAGQIDRCLDAFRSDMSWERIETDTMRLCQVVEFIARATDIELIPDRRSGLRKGVDRLVTWYRHIR